MTRDLIITAALSAAFLLSAGRLNATGVPGGMIESTFPPSASDLSPVNGSCDCDSAGCDSLAGRGCDFSGCGTASERMLSGLIKPSDRCFDDFISPMINFVYFEDPRNLTELRPIFLHHRLPANVGTGPLAAGGSVQLYALQFRIALTERASLIAVKDGYIVDNIGDGPVDGLIGDGWADVTVGLKYNLLRDVRRGRLWSAGFTYELPVGTPRAQQAVADGEGFRWWRYAYHRLPSLIPTGSSPVAASGRRSAPSNSSQQPSDALRGRSISGGHQSGPRDRTQRDRGNEVISSRTLIDRPLLRSADL